MDVVLALKYEQTAYKCSLRGGDDRFMVDLVICDRNYDILFEDRFDAGYMPNHQVRPGIWVPHVKWVPSHDFGKRAREVTRLLSANRVIIFGDADSGSENTRMGLGRLYKGNERYSTLHLFGIDYDRCYDKSYKYYVPRRANIMGRFFTLDNAVKLSFAENAHLNVQEPTIKEPIKTARDKCLGTAFVYNVVEEATKQLAA